MSEKINEKKYQAKCIDYLKEHSSEIWISENTKEKLVLETSHHDLGDYLDDFLSEIVDVEVSHLEGLDFESSGWTFVFEHPNDHDRKKILACLQTLGVNINVRGH